MWACIAEVTFFVLFCFTSLWLPVCLYLEHRELKPFFVCLFSFFFFFVFFLFLFFHHIFHFIYDYTVKGAIDENKI